MEKSDLSLSSAQSINAIVMVSKMGETEALAGRQRFVIQENQGKPMLEAIHYTADEVKKYLCEIFPDILKYANRTIQSTANESFEYSIGFYPIVEDKDGMIQLNILTAPVITHKISGTLKKKYGIFSYKDAPNVIEKFFEALWKCSEPKNEEKLSDEEEAMGVYNLGERLP